MKPHPIPDNCPRCGELKYPAAPICHLCYRDDLDKALSALRRALEWLPHQDGCAIRRGYACTCCHSGLYDTLRELGKP